MNDVARSGIVFNVAFTAKAPKIAAAEEPRIVSEERATRVSPRSSPIRASQRASLRLEPAPRRTRARLVGGTSRLARMLAFAHRVERAIEAGELRDFADAAARLGVSRPRITQIARLALLAPSIQEAILDASIDVTERDLRPISEMLDWDDQERRLRRFEPRFRRKSPR